jgi:hypothetical protein
MAASTPGTIVLKGMEQSIRHEALAGAAITPGMLVMLNSTAADTVVVHNADVIGAPWCGIAIEDDAQGRGITDAYDSTTYKEVVYVAPARGAEVYALVADGVNVTKGLALGSNGDGTLDLAVVTSPAVAEEAFGIALEAVDARSPAGNARIKVRVL